MKFIYALYYNGKVDALNNKHKYAYSLLFYSFVSKGSSTWEMNTAYIVYIEDLQIVVQKDTDIR